jgi:hypothetical protein
MYRRVGGMLRKGSSRSLTALPLCPLLPAVTLVFLAPAKGAIGAVDAREVLTSLFEVTLKLDAVVSVRNIRMNDVDWLDAKQLDDDTFDAVLKLHNYLQKLQGDAVTVPDSDD